MMVAEIEGNSANIEVWPQLLKNVMSFFHCAEQGSWYILQSNRLSLWWVCISFHHHHWWFILMIRSWRRPLVGSHPQLPLLRPHPSYWRPFVSTDCDISLTSLFSLHLSLLHSKTLEHTIISGNTHRSTDGLIFFHSALAYIHILLYGKSEMEIWPWSFTNFDWREVVHKWGHLFWGVSRPVPYWNM